MNMKITRQGNFTFALTDKKQTVFLNPSDKMSDKNLALSIFSEFEKAGDFSPAVDWPGEFEYAGISVKSFNTRENGLAQFFEFNGVRFGLLGDLKKIISEEKLEPLVNADVLFLPKTADGMSNKELKKLLEEIDPRIIVLCGEDLLFADLLKELGSAPLAATEDFEITKEKLPQDHSVFVNLSVV